MMGAFSACSLDENPTYTQTNNVVFSTADNAELALLGCYSYMTQGGGYGQMWQEVPIVASGLSYGQRNGGDGVNLAMLEALPQNTLVSSAWTGMYKVISEINGFIASMESSSLSDAVKTQKIGEAKFLRGMAYYNLASHFGAVPLKLVASTSDGIASSRDAVDVIYNQVIADFTAATAISETSSDGRANAWAAKAFLGKVHYKMAMLDIDRTNNLNKAKEYFDEVYNSGVYSLQADYAGLFGTYVTGSKESIFQLNFSPNTAGNTSYNRGSNRFSPTYSTAGVTWSTYSVQKYIYDLQQGTYPGDPRLDVNYLTRWRTRAGNNQANPRAQVGSYLSANDTTYLYPYRTYNDSTTIMASTVNAAGTTVNTYLVVPVRIPYTDLSTPINPDTAELNAYNNTAYSAMYNATVRSMVANFTAVSNYLKFPAYGKMYAQNQVTQSAPKNLMVYRYAEMLLHMADVYNELGNTARAIELANLVVARARNAGNNETYPQNWSTSLSKDEVTEKLYFERIFELAGEPNIYDMVRIRGTVYLKKLLTYNITHQLTVLGDARYTASPTNNWGDFVFNKGNLTDEFLRKNLLLPIPSSEIDANAGLTTDDQNYGY